MRRITLNTLVYTVLTASALQAQNFPGYVADLNRRGDSVARLEFWVNAVQAPHAGTPDEATRRIATWTLTDLDDLTIELSSLLKLMSDPRVDTFSVWVESGRTPGPRRVLYSGSELDRLRRLAPAAGGRSPQERPVPGDEARFAAAQNRLVKRGAALHTSVALGRPEEAEARAVNLFAPRWNGVVQFNDGRQVGLDGRANHWTFARRLLDRVTPAPSGDSAVRAWYHASSAVLLAKLQLYGEHFDDALRLFSDDPLLLMFNGSLHEAYASARVQPFVKSAVLPRGAVLRVGSPRTELGRAEALLQRALKIDPRAAEARVRLGRVLSLQARHADALDELRKLDVSAPSILQYYGSLFAGDAAEALGRNDEAHTAYERAANLYPSAQAPRMALSHLAITAGDRSRAANALETVLSPSKPEAEDDPFWTYYSAPGRDANALLTEAYRVLTAETP